MFNGNVTVRFNGVHLGFLASILIPPILLLIRTLQLQLGYILTVVPSMKRHCQAGFHTC